MQRVLPILVRFGASRSDDASIAVKVKIAENEIFARVQWPERWTPGSLDGFEANFSRTLVNVVERGSFL